MKLAATVTILLLHQGGFTGGVPETTEPFAADLRAAGYHTIAVPYRDDNPTGNILGEIATVRRYAKQAEANGPVVAYGLSAGATLAAALAATGDVAGAVVVAGPTDLVTWFCLSPLTVPSYWQGMGMTVADRIAASPIHRLKGKQAPQTLFYGDIDPLVTLNQGITYYAAARQGQPDTTFTLMPVAPHMFRDPYRVQARRWIQQRWPASPSGTAKALLQRRGV